MAHVIEQEFMEGPLVKWIRTFQDKGLQDLKLEDLMDGVLLNEVMLLIDPQASQKHVNAAIEEASVRVINIDGVLKNMKSYYEDVLGQVVVTRLPDPVILGKSSDMDRAVVELRVLLLLLLGCAVQCRAKEQFIERIKGLHLTLQHDIVNCIQQITENPEMVWMPEWNELSSIPDDQHEFFYRILVQHIRRLVKERDEFSQHVTKLILRERNSLNSVGSDGNGGISDQHHQAVELADYKAKLRRLRQECEEKSESLVESKEELEQVKQHLSKLRQENLELVQDARAAKAYRDELDILRERAQKVDKLETEVQRWRDKVNDIEFYKARVEELREDNRILVETKEMLEEQLENSRKRAEQVLELESEILGYKQQINALVLERDSDRKKLRQLIEENCQLQLCTKNSLNESANLVAELDLLKGQSSGVGSNSLCEQLGNDAHAKVLRLELENQRLMQIVESLKEDSFYQSSERILELEKETKRLSIKVTQLHETNQRDTQRSLELEQELEVKRREVSRLQDTIDTIKTNSDRQQQELHQEKQLLSDLVENLRERQQKSTSARLTDAETENKQLMERNLYMQSQVSRLEYEKQQMTKLNERLRESSEKLGEVEHLKAEYERENEDLKKTISAFKVACETHERLEEDFVSLEIENKRLSKYVDNLKQSVSKMDSVTQENARLSAENHKLQRSIEVMKNNSQQLATVEQEKEELSKNNQILISKLEAIKVETAKMEELEISLLSSSTECQKLHKSLDSAGKKLEDLERENREFESENGKLQKTVETLKLSARRLNDLEKETTELETDNHRIDRENKSLEKEVARLKQAIEVKDSTLDDCMSRVSTLEREGKRLQKELDSANSSAARLRELEQENREMVQQGIMNKRTLCALREELVAEKIRVQQSRNELDKVMGELQRIGIDREKLAMNDEEGTERFLALESMVEDALKKGLQVKEEKIQLLERRLQESSALNRELRQEMIGLRREVEGRRQREEEQENTQDNISHAQVEILKERLEEVTGQNATLHTENQNLRSQATSLREQISALHNQVTALQKQATLLTQGNAALQTEFAKLQVESTTLQSQNASLTTQMASLHALNVQGEANKDKVLKQLESLQSAHSQLTTDQEALHKIHDQLIVEYDTLKRERDSLKSSLKEAKGEYKLLQEQYDNLNSRQEDVQKLRDILETETEHLRSDSKSLSNLRAEHSRLKDDFRCLFTANERLKGEYRGLQTDYKSIKTENNQMKLRQTEMQGEFADAQDQTHVLGQEISSLNNKCEVLAQLNTTLEEDRRSLMSQVTILLTQYHELLTQTLEDKEHFHSEEKLFADKVNNLKRQKEKLEEKIMEQYKKMENNYSPKKRGFGSTLVRRMRRAGSELMSKVPRTGRSRSRNRGLDGNDNTDSIDNSSLGSGSGGQESMDGTDTRRSSPQDLIFPSDSASDCGDNRPSTHLSRHDAFLSDSHRKSLPLLRDDKRYRDSFSSADVLSLKAESSDGQEDSTRTVLNSDQDNASQISSNLSLGSAGTRRAVYYTDEDENNVSGRESQPEPLLNRTGRASIRSAPDYPSSPRSPRRSAGLHSDGPHPERPPNNIPNGRSGSPMTLSANINCVVQVSSPLAESTPLSRRGSLPHVNGSPWNSKENSPQHHLNGTILGPGKGIRPSSQPSSSRLPPPPPPPKPNRTFTENTTEGKPREVDNSIWYEYGCV